MNWVYEWNGIVCNVVTVANKGVGISWFSAPLSSINYEIRYKSKKERKWTTDLLRRRNKS